MPATLDLNLENPPFPLDLPQDQPTQSLFDRTVCIVIGISGFSNRRKLSTSLIEVDADKALIGASKQRLVAPELNDVSRRDKTFRDALRKISLPAPLKAGSFLLPIAQIGAAQKLIADYETDRRALIDTFIEAYPTRYDETLLSLRGVHNPLDYPVTGDDLRTDPNKADLLRREFSFTHKCITFGPPHKLQTVDPELFRREAEKAAAEWQEFRQGVLQMLRQEMLDTVNHVVEKLTGTRDNGNPKIIHQSFLPQITEWLNLINDRNVVDDAPLRELSLQMRELLSGVNRQELKSDTKIRETVRAGFAEIQKTLSGMMVDRPSRLISFEDE